MCKKTGIDYTSAIENVKILFLLLLFFKAYFVNIIQWLNILYVYVVFVKRFSIFLHNNIPPNQCLPINLLLCG